MTCQIDPFPEFVELKHFQVALKPAAPIDCQEITLIQSKRLNIPCVNESTVQVNFNKRHTKREVFFTHPLVISLWVKNSIENVFMVPVNNVAFAAVTFF